MKDTVARLRELLAEADDYRTLGRPEVERSEAAVMHAIAAALPSLLDRLEAAEVVVEAAGEVNNAAVLMCHATDGDPGCMAERVSLDAAADALRAALRRYTEVPRG